MKMSNTGFQTVCKLVRILVYYFMHYCPRNSIAVLKFADDTETVSKMVRNAYLWRNENAYTNGNMLLDRKLDILL